MSSHVLNLNVGQSRAVTHRPLLGVTTIAPPLPRPTRPIGPTRPTHPMYPICPIPSLPPQTTADGRLPTGFPTTRLVDITPIHLR